MREEQIAVNIYTIRRHLQTPEDFRESIGKLADIGLSGLEFCGVPGMMPLRDARRICEDAGCAILSSHEAPVKLLESPQRSVDRLGELGVKRCVYGWAGDIDFSNAVAVDDWLVQLERTAETLQRAGISLIYHHHDMELIRVRGQVVLERVFRETSLDGELDTYWLQVAGADVKSWIRHWAQAGRLPFIHLKDVVIHPPRETRFGVLGEGNIEFAEVIDIAERGGCEYFVIEQDECYEESPFACIERSFRYLQHLAVR